MSEILKRFDANGVATELRIEYDDDCVTIMDGVNALLEPHGLKFHSDDEVRDGFEIYELMELSKMPKRKKFNRTQVLTRFLEWLSHEYGACEVSDLPDVKVLLVAYKKVCECNAKGCERCIIPPTMTYPERREEKMPPGEPIFRDPSGARVYRVDEGTNADLRIYNADLQYLGAAENLNQAKMYLVSATYCGAHQQPHTQAEGCSVCRARWARDKKL